MQFSTIFLAIGSAAFIDQALAGCYSGGGSWGAERGYAEQAVDGLCNSASEGGFTQTSFFSGQTKAICAPLTNEKKVDLSIHWGGTGTVDLGDGDCNLRLKNEINGCENGGDSTIDNWRFM